MRGFIIISFFSSPPLLFCVSFLIRASAFFCKVTKHERLRFIL